MIPSNFMDYREPLPPNCPPEDAEEIQDERLLYRLVASMPPSDTDFQSQRAARPDATFDVPECLARGLSVDTERSGIEKTAKLPRFKRRQICAIRVGPGAGRLKQTFQPTHHTWWPLADFDILSHCSANP